MKNADTSAMPLPIAAENEGGIIDTGDYCPHNSGLTKREHFAAMAMQGMCAAYDLEETYQSEGSDSRVNARLAVEHADALLAALEES